MAKKYYPRLDDERPGAGFYIALCGERVWCSRQEGVAAAQDIYAQTLLGASREEAEQIAREHLLSCRKAKKWFDEK